MGHAMDKYRHGTEPYAFVTGASGGECSHVLLTVIRSHCNDIGIGRSCAFVLARLGFNVIIHAATQEELKVVQNEIMLQTPGVHVICAPQDSSAEVNWDEFMEPLKNLNITVLINNVGVSAINGCGFNALERASCQAIEQNIRINAIFPTQLTRNLLPALSVNSPSLILNLTSASVWTKPPLISVYTGTKAYNLMWSECLRNELRLLGKDIECKAIMTGAVSTTGYSIAENFWTPNSDTYAESMLARAGASGPMYYGIWKHQLQVQCESQICVQAANTGRSTTFGSLPPSYYLTVQWKNS